MFGGFLEEKSRLRKLNVWKGHVTVLKLSTEFRYKIAEDKVERSIDADKNSLWKNVRKLFLFYLSCSPKRWKENQFLSF